MKNSFGQKILNNLLTMLADEKFREEVISIRKKFQIPETGIDDSYKERHGRHAFLSCAENLEKLRVKYKLNEHYGIFLMYIVIFGKRPNKSILNDTSPFELMHYQEKSGLNCAAIKIYQETTIKDIQNNWDIIKKFSEETYEREVKAKQRPINNAERDFYIRKLKNWGFKNRQTSQIINNIFPQEGVISYTDIPKITERNKRKAAKLLQNTNKTK
ncbi:MAG: hypothetical protein WC545_00505 [Patescibacteria group bacterium]